MFIVESILMGPRGIYGYGNDVFQYGGGLVLCVDNVVKLC